jgi:hypothetical protein
MKKEFTGPRSHKGWEKLGIDNTLFPYPYILSTPDYYNLLLIRSVALKFAGALDDLWISLFKNFQLKQLALGYLVLLETRLGTRSRNSSYCMEHECQLQYAQELATCKRRHFNPVRFLPSWQCLSVTFHRISHSVVRRLFKVRRLASHPTTKLEVHPCSAVRCCWFGVFSATCHVCRPS